jgi:hypothetical protein
MDGAERDDQPRAGFRATRRWFIPYFPHVPRDKRSHPDCRAILTYEMPTGTGKTSAQTDTFHGRFVKLAENKQVVQVVEFETQEPAMRGEMTITYTLADAEGGTDVLWEHDGIPPGVSPADNELGSRMALAKLATLVEAG